MSAEMGCSVPLEGYFRPVFVLSAPATPFLFGFGFQRSTVASPNWGSSSLLRPWIGVAREFGVAFS